MTGTVYLKTLIGTLEERRIQPTTEELQKVFEWPYRAVYTTILNLTTGEDLSGEITNGGSIAVNGASALRRTFSGLQLVVRGGTPRRTYDWVMKNKIRIFQGIQNEMTKGEIWYFNLGTFHLSTFSQSEDLASIKISMSGKDSMVLLNGELGGTFTVDTKLHERIEPDGSKKYNSIKEIITQVVTLGGISKDKIFIEDDNTWVGKELLEYRGTSPLYIIAEKNAEDKWIGKEVISHGTQKVTISNGKQVSLDSFPWGDTPESNRIIEGNKQYFRIKTGESAGYKIVELTYPGELIAKAGETVVSVLDKIVNMFGKQWEYFFDVDDNFHFCTKTAKLDFTTQDTSDSWAEDNSINSDNIYNPIPPEIIYNFSDKTLITSFGDTPKIEDLKNDFVIWGTRKSVNGGEGQPIHARYIVDEPFRAADGTELFSQKDICEELYQMASGKKKIPNGKEYYAQLFPDILGFWRDIYNPNAINHYKVTTARATGNKSPTYWHGNKVQPTTDKNNIYVPQGKINDETIYTSYANLIDLSQYSDVFKQEEDNQFVSLYDSTNYENQAIVLGENKTPLTSWFYDYFSTGNIEILASDLFYQLKSQASTGYSPLYRTTTWDSLPDGQVDLSSTFLYYNNKLITGIALQEGGKIQSTKDFVFLKNKSVKIYTIQYLSDSIIDSQEQISLKTESITNFNGWNEYIKVIIPTISLTTENYYQYKLFIQNPDKKYISLIDILPKILSGKVIDNNVIANEVFTSTWLANYAINYGAPMTYMYNNRLIRAFSPGRHYTFKITYTNNGSWGDDEFKTLLLKVGHAKASDSIEIGTIQLAKPIEIGKEHIASATFQCGKHPLENWRNNQQDNGYLRLYSEHGNSEDKRGLQILRIEVEDAYLAQNSKSLTIFDKNQWQFNIGKDLFQYPLDSIKDLDKSILYKYDEVNGYINIFDSPIPDGAIAIETNPSAIENMINNPASGAKKSSGSTFVSAYTLENTKYMYKNYYTLEPGRYYHLSFTIELELDNNWTEMSNNDNRNFLHFKIGGKDKASAIPLFPDENGESKIFIDFSTGFKQTYEIEFQCNSNYNPDKYPDIQPTIRLYNESAQLYGIRISNITINNMFKVEEKNLLRFKYLPANWKGELITKGITTTTKYHPCYYSALEYDTITGFKLHYLQDPTLIPFKLVWIYPGENEKNLNKITITEVKDRVLVKNEKAVTSLNSLPPPPLYFSTEESPAAAGVIEFTETLQKCFTLQAQGISATDYIKQILYDYAYCVDNVSASIMPIYFLEPNKYIQIEKDIYLLSSFNIPLNYNGTMNLTLTKEKITSR